MQVEQLNMPLLTVKGSWMRGSQVFFYKGVNLDDVLPQGPGFAIRYQANMPIFEDGVWGISIRLYTCLDLDTAGEIMKLIPFWKVMSYDDITEYLVPMEGLDEDTPYCYNYKVLLNLEMPKSEVE